MNLKLKDTLKSWLFRLNTPGDFLYLQTQRLSVWQAQAGEWQPVRHFAATPEGQAELAAYLHRRRTPLRLLVERGDESYRYENLPPLGASDFRRYTARRLAEQFPDTPFRLAQRTADGALYAALTDAAGLTPWLDALQTQSLAGIHTVPQLCAALLAPLCRLLPGEALTSHLLLVTTASPAGWSASYFVGGELRFAHHSRPEDGHLPDEISRIRHYLHSQHQWAHDQTLSVLLLGDAFPELQAEPGLTIDRIGLPELARAIGYPGKIDALPPLLLHRFDQQPPAEQFAPPALTRRFRLRRLHQSLYGVCGLLWLGSAAWSGALLWQAADWRAETATLSAATVRLRQNWPQPPDLPVPLAELKSALALLPAADPPAQSLLQGLSVALDARPTVELTELGWSGTTLVFHARSASANDWPDFRRRLTRDYARITELQSSVAPDGQTSVIWQLGTTGTPP